MPSSFTICCKLLHDRCRWVRCRIHDSGVVQERSSLHGPTHRWRKKQAHGAYLFWKGSASKIVHRIHDNRCRCISPAIGVSSTLVPCRLSLLTSPSQSVMMETIWRSTRVASILQSCDKAMWDAILAMRIYTRTSLQSGAISINIVQQRK